MKRIFFPLKTGMSAAKVADLQNTIRIFLDNKTLHLTQAQIRLLMPRFIAEQRDKNYGKTTKTLVSAYQKIKSLKATGEVDKATAEALNNELESLGLLEPVFGNMKVTLDRLSRSIRSANTQLGKPDKNDSGITRQTTSVDDIRKIVTDHAGKLGNIESDTINLGGISRQQQVVSGIVSWRDGSPLPGVIVGALHRGDKSDILLGESPTDIKGNYSIRYNRLPNVEVIKLVVVVIEPKSGKPLSESKPKDNPKIQEVINLEIPIIVKPTTKRWIEGRVVYEDGTPAEKLTLRLYCLGISGKDVELGDGAETGASGHYTLSYQVTEHELLLEIRAVFGNPEEVVTLSKPLVDLPERAVVNLVMPTAAEKPKSEYEFLAELLEPHVGNNMERLENIREDSERRDISDLNRATGLDTRQILLASQSARLCKDTEWKLSQEGLYGCLRAGLPSDKELFAQVDPDVVENLLKKVRDLGIVALDDDTISDFRKNFEEFARKVRMPPQDQVLVNIIEKDDSFKTLRVANSTVQKLKKGINKKGFRLGASSIGDFFTTIEKDKNDKILLEEEELKQITTLQRIYQITPSYKAIAVLRNMEIHSAYDVVSMPEEVFARSFEKIYLKTFTERSPAGLVALIYSKATHRIRNNRQ